VSEDFVEGAGLQDFIGWYVYWLVCVLAGMCIGWYVYWLVCVLAGMCIALPLFLEHGASNNI